MRKNKCTLHRPIQHISPSLSLEYSTHFNLSAMMGTIFKQFNSDHFYSDFLLAFTTHLSYLSLFSILFLNTYNFQATLIVFNKLTDILTSHQISYISLLPIDLTSYNTYIYQLPSHLYLVLSFIPKRKFLYNTHTHHFPSHIYLLLAPIPKRRFLVKTLHNKALLEIITLIFRLAQIRTNLTMSEISKNCDMVFEDSVEQQKTYVNLIFLTVNYFQSPTYIAFLFSLTYRFKNWSGLLFCPTIKQILIFQQMKLKFPQA